MSQRENANDFGDSIFGGEDETSVDMEMIKEKIKLVPLSDMDFEEPPDDVMDVDSSMREEILAPLNLTPPHHSKSEGSLKHLHHKDDSRLEVLEGDSALKLSKIDGDICAAKAGDPTSTAAKVAAEVSPDIVTGGVVAEAGPPPDFSLWTVEDDVVLKNAMESGAAMEALAKGAVKFSQCFTLRELRERWRALLYDPVISEEAALRILKSETLVTNPGKLSNPNKLKYPLVSNRKRNLRSVRFQYYNRKKHSDTGKVFNCLADNDNDDMDSLSEMPSKEPELCMETSLPQRVRHLTVGTAGEISEAIPSDHQEDSVFMGRLALDNTPVEAPDGLDHLLSPPQHGARTSPPHQSSMMDLFGGSNMSSLEEEDTNAHRISNPDGLDGLIFSQQSAQEGGVEVKGTGTTDTKKAFDKPLVVDVPPLDQMICVLNTEDTEIPSPPPGSVSTSPFLFSSRYPSEMKSFKNEPGFLGGGYGRSNELNFSGHGLLRSVLEDRRIIGPFIKQESTLEDVAIQNDDKEPFESLEKAGGHAVRSGLLSSHTSAENLPAGLDVAFLNSDEPRFSKELVSPLQAGILSQLEQDVCYINQTAGVLAMKRDALSCQDHEDGLASDKDLPSFSDVEAMILDVDLDPIFDEDAVARAASRRLYRRQRKTLMRLEQGAKAALERAMTNRGAIAVLYGHHLQYHIKRNEVLLGRMTLENSVDIDLGKEGRANKVSRRQATIRLKEDGVFYLKNLGRRDLSVNNIPIASGQHAILGSNCLIEVGGMRFIFEINRNLVRRRVAEMLDTRLLG